MSANAPTTDYRTIDLNSPCNTCGCLAARQYESHTECFRCRAILSSIADEPRKKQRAYNAARDAKQATLSMAGRSD